MNSKFGLVYTCDFIWPQLYVILKDILWLLFFPPSKYLNVGLTGAYVSGRDAGGDRMML